MLFVLDLGTRLPLSHLQKFIFCQYITHCYHNKLGCKTFTLSACDINVGRDINILFYQKCSYHFF